MIRDVILPQLAMGMSEGTIVNWVVPEGAVVQKEQALLSIETEKVTTELPAPYSGYVHHIARAGDVFPVETVIGKIALTSRSFHLQSVKLPSVGVLIEFQMALASVAELARSTFSTSCIWRHLGRGSSLSAEASLHTMVTPDRKLCSIHSAF